MSRFPYSIQIITQEGKGESTLLPGSCIAAGADMKKIIRYSHMKELTQELVDTFIERIYVYKDNFSESQ